MECFGFDRDSEGAIDEGLGPFGIPYLPYLGTLGMVGSILRRTQPKMLFFQGGFRAPTVQYYVKSFREILPQQKINIIAYPITPQP